MKTGNIVEDARGIAGCLLTGCQEPLPSGDGIGNNNFAEEERQGRQLVRAGLRGHNKATLPTHKRCGLHRNSEGLQLN